MLSSTAGSTSMFYRSRIYYLLYSWKVLSTNHETEKQAAIRTEITKNSDNNVVLNHFVSHPSPDVVGPKVIPVTNKVVVRNEAVQGLSNKVDVDWLLPNSKPETEVYCHPQQLLSYSLA